MLNPRLPPWIENENYLNFSIYKDPPFATSPTPATATSCPVWLAGYIAGWCGRPKFLWGPMRAYPRKGALRKILDNSRCFKHVLTCFNHVLTCFNMFQPWMFGALFSDTVACFLMTMCLLTMWKRHELRTYLCSVLDVFGGARVFQKMLHDEPASWTQFYLVNPIINIDKPTRAIFGQILRHWWYLGMIYYWVVQFCKTSASFHKSCGCWAGCGLLVGTAPKK